LGPSAPGRVERGGVVHGRSGARPWPHASKPRRAPSGVGRQDPQGVHGVDLRLRAARAVEAPLNESTRFLGAPRGHRVVAGAFPCTSVDADEDDPAICMKPQPESSPQEVLAGLVERVTFHNVENGFCVLRAKARGHRELVTVIGHAAIISAGEWITATGDWVNDRTHGQQFKARFLRTSTPTSADGIEKYLSSGMIRGVGPAYAKKLVRAFGEKVFDVIEATPDRLREVDGIGPVRAARGLNTQP
jgi:hypothetical protein